MTLHGEVDKTLLKQINRLNIFCCDDLALIHQLLEPIDSNRF